MTETSTIGGEHLQRPCHGIESSEGGGFQWVQAAPGDSLQPEATGAGIEISGHRRGHRITPGPAGLSEVLQFARRPAGPVCSRLSAGGSRIRTIGPALVKGLSAVADERCRTDPRWSYSSSSGGRCWTVWAQRVRRRWPRRRTWCAGLSRRRQLSSPPWRRYSRSTG